VTPRHGGLHTLPVEPAPIIHDLEQEPRVDTPQGHPDLGRAGVRCRVRRQLACERHDEAVVGPHGTGIDVQAPSGSAPPPALDDRVERGLQPGLLEQVWVQIGDRGS
jgi:hypothetical protein